MFLTQADFALPSLTWVFNWIVAFQSMSEAFSNAAAYQLIEAFGLTFTPQLMFEAFDSTVALQLMTEAFDCVVVSSSTTRVSDCMITSSAVARIKFSADICSVLMAETSSCTSFGFISMNFETFEFFNTFLICWINLDCLKRLMSFLNQHTNSLLF